ncbi:AAA family ATPase [uncultured Parabacteroides sp.]|uniref:ATP-dependent nuclease n=1 Tax=uncultured Parabacteroides sp. TaxID=512312 RepID=UPI00262C3E50|nr:AAA family ATPase [uncultured Parabacteroides sp.]
MHLSVLKLWNFRKYSEGPNGEPGLVVNFHEGVNVLIGENDSGKTAIVDAIRYALKTQSGEFIQFDDKDFYQDVNGNRKEEFKIECVFDGLNEQDSGLFWEWLSWNDDKTRYLLKVWLYAKRKDNVIMPSFTAGIEGQADRMDSEARELLKVVYFKPLRDALTDMTHGYKSRLAQILGAHELFKTQKDAEGNSTKHKLETDYENLKREIENYFKDGGNGSIITGDINKFLKKHFLLNGDPRNAQIKLTGGELTDILRLLDLIMEGNKSGLGTLNLLCIAAEMLLFSNQKKGLKLAIVEELEAHLHPQYQLRLIDYISSQQNNEQFILSTHSITLASKIRLENLIILKDKEVYPMSADYTMMNPADYKFLERFLDATKANLFFAKGLIMVEGDAENLLIPAIAELMDRHLHKHGVSIVNVGSTAYKRYVSIFKRKDEKTFDIPIAVISDLDVKALEYYDDNSKDRKIPKYWLKDTVLTELKAITEEVDYEAMANVYRSLTAFEKEVRSNKTENFVPIGETIERLKAVLTDDKKTKLDEAMLSTIREDRIKRLKSEINKGKTKIYLPKDWTLEYEIAGSGLYRLLVTATRAAKIETDNPDLEMTDETLLELWSKVKEDYPDGHVPTREDIYRIFAPLNEGVVSKAITAQYLAGMISGELPPVKGNDEMKGKVKGIIETDDRMKYLKEAIEHVTA